MIFTSDQTFKQCLKILLEDEEQKPVLSKLAQWISSEYKVNVVGVFEVQAQHSTRFKLDVVLMYNEQVKLFEEKAGFNFSKTQQVRILKKYVELRQQEQTFIQRFLRNQIDENAFVVFSGFDSTYYEFVFKCISDAQLSQIVVDCRIPVKRIERMFSYLVFFLETEADLTKIDVGTMDLARQKLAKCFVELDLLELLSDRAASIHFDSLENLDKNYRGSMMYYYRDH